MTRWLPATAAAALVAAAPPAAERSTFVTLGTMAGPIADAHRSQPANLLLADRQAILIDAGDGAAEQLAKAAVPLASIRTVFLSHLHFDHTGGLFAILGMRFQVMMPGTLTIYGPPGTRRLVDGMIDAMAPAAEAGSGLPGARPRDPKAGIRVEEIGDGAHLTFGAIAVSAVRNSHYSFPGGSAEAERFQSLSFRFDLPDRSIMYTGDTGPSPAVERLAKGADLMISEVIDADAALAEVKHVFPDLPPAAIPAITRHFLEQHLSGDAAGRLARAAGVRRLVLTHVGIGPRPPETVSAPAASAFGGPVVVANDLDRF